MAAMPRVPSRADVEEIGAWPQPVLRNLRITQAYHELSGAVARVTGPGANWCTFATWASRQAGQSIRGDDLGRKIEDAFRGAEAIRRAVEVIREVRRAIGRAIDASAVLDALREVCAPLLTAGRVADAVARGNKTVFDEIGLEFARFLAIWPAGAGAALERFCGGLRPGDPPGGQRLLAAAFRDYDRARATADDKARAERLLLANLRIGLHEQTRLDPEIAEALNAPLPDPAMVARRLAAALFPGLERLPEPLARRVSGVLHDAAGRLVERLRAVVRAVITDELMTLELPDGALRLGHDLRGPFPPALRVLADPDLVELLARVDPTGDSLRETGASDWASLAERMHFIADLFRLRHASAALFRAPFTPAQLESIRAGRIPDGAL
jgi:hypothetical protein